MNDITLRFTKVQSHFFVFPPRVWFLCGFVVLSANDGLVVRVLKTVEAVSSFVGVSGPIC